MRSLKIFCVLSMYFGLIGLAGGNSVTLVNDFDPPHLTHLTADRGPRLAPLADDCTACHTETPGDYDNLKDPIEAACNTCHSPGGVYDGVNQTDPNIGALNNWENMGDSADATQSLIYGEDGNLKSGKEKWCAGCHDDGVAFSRPEIIHPVIVDNDNKNNSEGEVIYGEATYAPSEGDWPHSTNNPGPGEFYGTDVQYHAAGGDGSATATWSPGLPEDGAYNVYARWTSYYNRASSVPYKINYNGGPHTERVNQQQEGGRWVKLGTYPFLAGTGGSVVLSDNATGGTIIIADAVMFENVENMGAYAPNVVGDNVTYGFYVTGHKVGCTNCHDSESPHIDHNPRTYEVSEADLVVIKSYEYGYRLKDVAGASQPMVIPKETVAGGSSPTALDPAEFALCGLCHDLDPILSTFFPPDTNFYDSDDPYKRNFHQYHLNMDGNVGNTQIWDSDWDAVVGGSGGASLDSMASCPTCHNVHGSQSATMTRHGELISTPGTDKVPSLDFCYLNEYEERDCNIMSALDSTGGSMHFSGGFPETGNFVCQDCHGGYPKYVRTPQDIQPPMVGKGHDIHISSDKGPMIEDCTDCHHSSSYSLFSDEKILEETHACDTCHSPEGAFNGVDSSGESVGAKDNWADGVYSEDGKSLKDGKDKWCVGCHDGGDPPAFSRAEIVEPVIVDNLAATYTPSGSAWPHSTGRPPFYATDVQYHAAGGNGSATATWAPDLPEDGNYNVYAMWTSYYNRADHTPYTIHYTGGDDGGSDTKWVNQQQEGGRWVKLGTYPFLAGTGGSVVLSDNATGGTIIIADAVMFENVDNMGAYAPDVAGDNSSYGYYVNGHNLNCSVCHDITSKHIDHNQRSYEIDEETCDPGPCEVVTSYEDGYRLKSVGGQRPMVVPKEAVANPNALDPSEFALCFKCHDSEGILSTSWAGTNFKRDSDPYQRNFHQYHLGMSAIIWDSDWDAIINGTPLVSVDSMPSCTACHNIHGSPSATMTRHGELISTAGTTDKVPSLNFCYLDEEGKNCSIDDPLASIGGSMYFAGYPERGNFVCADCHGGFRDYVREPQNIPTPVAPIVSNATASPVSVANDGDSSVLFTAFVVDPNDNLDSVEIDLLALGGSETQAMSDDGTNGDVTAGDDIYSYLLSWTSADTGKYALMITAKDPFTNTGTGEARVVVHDEDDAIIVDNLEADFVCSWATTTGLPDQLWGFDAQFRLAESGTDCTATWVFDVPTTGNYNVYARWTSNIYRATNVPYTINYNGSNPQSDIRWVNQQQYGGTWNQLGSGPYHFEAGTPGSVVLSATEAYGGPSASRRNFVIADSIKLVPATP